jgi:hypothetical protein
MPHILVRHLLYVNNEHLYGNNVLPCKVFLKSFPYGAFFFLSALASFIECSSEWMSFQSL